MLKIDKYRSGSVNNCSCDNSDPFGQLGADRYDIDSLYMAPRYSRAHAVQNQIVRECIRKKNGPGWVIDFGCGTASDAVEILGKLKDSYYLGVDRASAMLRRATQKIRENGLADRATFVEADFTNANEASYFKAMNDLSDATRIDAIVCSFALHHCDKGERDRLYNFAKSFAGIGTVFVISDLFLASDGICNEVSISEELRDIRVAVENIRGTQALGPVATTVSESHYLMANKPTALMEEYQCLIGHGYCNVDIAFRDAQVGVLVAVQ